MDTVIVETKHKQHYYKSTEPFVYNTIIGEILTDKHWLQPNEIAVSNPNHPNGFSVIAEQNIVAITNAEGIKVTIPKKQADKEWKVTGSKGDIYLVKRTNGHYTCQCPGFQYRGKCRHITECAEND